MTNGMDKQITRLTLLIQGQNTPGDIQFGFERREILP